MTSLLIITPFLPYPICSGGDQAQYNVIENLRQFYNISLVFPINQDNHRGDIQELSSRWQNVKFYPFSLKDQLLSFPFLIRKIGKVWNRYINPNRRRSTIAQAIDSKDFLLSKRYVAFLNRIINDNQPEIIQVEFLPNLNVIECLPKGIKKVFIHHEVGFVIIERALKDFVLTKSQQQKVIQKKKLEISRLNLYDSVITVTEKDKKILQDSGVEVPIYVSPSAVNTSVKNYDGWNRKIVFVGGYNHRPNHEGMDWFLSQITSLIKWEDFPQTELIIIGTGWPQSYKGEHNGLKVNLLGYVDDLATVVYGSVMIVPLLTGSGMRMKILDAAALSVPFVATSVGAEGLDFSDGNSCVIGDTDKEFAEGLVKLMKDDKLREDMAKRSHQIFLEKYSLSALIENRHNIYKEILSD